jgi:hypothetical protein
MNGKFEYKGYIGSAEVDADSGYDGRTFLISR